MSGILVIREDDKLVEMTETPYATEELLQQLLAKYPNLLAGDQMDSSEPRRWLLITREMGVPGEEEGADRWSLDHLFLDQEATPTLVEVKRSSDTRSRREVVAQMLDYAANAVAYWPVEQIQAKFEQRCDREGKSAAEALADHLQEDADPTEFWQRVKLNIQAGRIRMVFVADAISVELRRIIEFLNEQMNPAEVLAVEIKQYVGEGMRSLVPRLLGQTVAAQEKKSGGSAKPRKTDEATFLNEILKARGQEEADLAKRLVDWSRQLDLTLNFNNNIQSVSFIPFLEVGGSYRYPVSISTNGDIWIQMRWLKAHAPFDDGRKREELRQKFNQLVGVEIPEERMTGFPKIPIQSLKDDSFSSQFLEILTWMVNELCSTDA